MVVGLTVAAVRLGGRLVGAKRREGSELGSLC